MKGALCGGTLLRRHCIKCNGRLPVNKGSLPHMAKPDHSVKIRSVGTADALRAALPITDPDAAIEGAKRHWEKEKSGKGRRGRPKKEGAPAKRLRLLLVASLAKPRLASTSLAIPCQMSGEPNDGILNRHSHKIKWSIQGHNRPAPCSCISAT